MALDGGRAADGRSRRCPLRSPRPRRSGSDARARRRVSGEVQLCSGKCSNEIIKACTAYKKSELTLKFKWVRLSFDSVHDFPRKCERFQAFAVTEDCKLTPFLPQSSRDSSSSTSKLTSKAETMSPGPPLVFAKGPSSTSRRSSCWRLKTTTAESLSKRRTSLPSRRLSTVVAWISTPPNQSISSRLIRRWCPSSPHSTSTK